ncbi:hypothetical protein [Bacillus marasmi]|uniref:hypothetical protein n=1 Tax=Bacillus marasmi TaxID=1926279 RepID=UPI0011CCA29A|nr:hypothetical protein [Bacillus marasmi]
MKFKKPITILVLMIILLSLFASVYGAIANGGPGQHTFTSIEGLTISIYGKGLYENDSVAMAVQARAQDVVTLCLGIPLLSLSLYLSRKNSLRGRLLLTGTLGYFLYTYAVYTFVAMYNSFFLVFVALMSLSFFAFVLAMMSFDVVAVKNAFSIKLPVLFIATIMILLSVAVGMMWLGKILPPLVNGTPTEGLEHYTTLVVQGIDLGIIIPVSILGAVLLIRKQPYGYLLTTVLYMKIITLLTALTAMIIGQALTGVSMGAAEIIIFPVFNLLAIYCLYLILKNIILPVESGAVQANFNSK